MVNVVYLATLYKELTIQQTKTNKVASIARLQHHNILEETMLLQGQDKRIN